MNCTRCSHPYTQHRVGKERKCATRIAYGWDEATKQFAGTAPCLCPCYRGALPGHECPHEYTKQSVKCVHCGHTMATEEKKTT